MCRRAGPAGADDRRNRRRPAGSPQGRPTPQCRSLPPRLRLGLLGPRLGLLGPRLGLLGPRLGLLGLLELRELRELLRALRELRLRLEPRPGLREPRLRRRLELQKEQRLLVLLALRRRRRERAARRMRALRT